MIEKQLVNEADGVYLLQPLTPVSAIASEIPDDLVAERVSWFEKWKHDTIEHMNSLMGIAVILSLVVVSYLLSTAESMLTARGVDISNWLFGFIFLAEATVRLIWIGPWANFTDI